MDAVKSPSNTSAGIACSTLLAARAMRGLGRGSRERGGAGPEVACCCVPTPREGASFGLPLRRRPWNRGASGTSACGSMACAFGAGVSPSTRAVRRLRFRGRGGRTGTGCTPLQVPARAGQRTGGCAPLGRRGMMLDYELRSGAWGRPAERWWSRCRRGEGPFRAKRQRLTKQAARSWAIGLSRRRRPALRGRARIGALGREPGPQAGTDGGRRSPGRRRRAEFRERPGAGRGMQREVLAGGRTAQATGATRGLPSARALAGVRGPLGVERAGGWRPIRGSSRPARRF